MTGERECRLAMDGGPPAVTCGPFAWPPADEAVREALDQAWRDGDWGRYHGQRCEQLRERLAAHHGVAHAHVCSSGTVAVELALRAVGVAAGDGVALAAYDFPGNFRAVEAVGATPVLVDVDPHTWSIDVAALADCAREAETHRVRAVIVSHLHGGLARMTALRELADTHGWKVIEDACQVAGATLEGTPAGAWGDVGVQSFGGSKLLTAGRGGALLTNDPMIAQRARVAAGRGNDAWPLSELQAAVLLPQLETLAARHVLREANADRLREATAAHAEWVRPVGQVAEASHAYYKFGWAVAEGDAAWVVAALQAEGAPVDRGFRGFVDRSERRCRRLTPFPHSTHLSTQATLLHHPALLKREAVDQLAIAIEKIATARSDAS